jgi:hypothetical protein
VSIFRTPRRDQTSAARLRERERKATAASQQAHEAQYVAAVSHAQRMEAQIVTDFINAGENWWLDDHQAWLDARIAEETARGGSSFS